VFGQFDSYVGRFLIFVGVHNSILYWLTSSYHKLISCRRHLSHSQPKILFPNL
jgi:hypothetical protein